MDRVLDHFLYVLELHANNRFVVYSPVLAAQIPTSLAAHAFKVFQRGMHQIEIVRLCALWDSADPDKENIPTVIELIDEPFDHAIAVPHQRLNDFGADARVAQQPCQRGFDLVAVEPAEHAHERRQFVAAGRWNGMYQRPRNVG